MTTNMYLFDFVRKMRDKDGRAQEILVPGSIQVHPISLSDGPSRLGPPWDNAPTIKAH